MAFLVNPHLQTDAVTAPTTAAAGFHHALPEYAPTPVRELAGGVLVKDESDRLGLPAFKILGASWAVERALARAPATTTLVAASAGNHGRAVAHEAARRGLGCRVFLPERSLAVRREAIESEGAEVVVVDGTYERCVALAPRGRRRAPGALEIADVGESGPAGDVIDGYATLFDEAAGQVEFDLLIVPVGVGSLAAAAARFGARAGIPRGGCRARHRRVPDRVAGRRRAGRRGHARHDDGGPGLRRGLARGVARPARAASPAPSP